ncbi:NCS1 family transporter [Neobacillus bataviensis]|uniref:NCS1 family transporter n=1 Tax=Neobacillus bataviensis TaxID=220685 RepID=UPI001CBADB3D|nr:NCS1 family transporter [Neobacillus bataviensis]
MPSMPEASIMEKTEVQFDTNIDESLKPTSLEHRELSPVKFMFMWLGEGVNMGNITIGSSLFVAGVATLNFAQTLVATIIALAIITTLFVLNGRLAYNTGIPYVVHLRMSFGMKGGIISSLLRGIPAIVWYGFQSWIGATALNEIVKVFSSGTFDNIFISFLVLQGVQIFLSMFGFHAIKWVQMVTGTVIMLALAYVFVILMKSHSDVMAQNWVHVKGSWGVPFVASIMVMLGNYAALFLSAADYSRELKSGMSKTKQSFVYLIPLIFSYGFAMIVGAMLSSATGIINPVKAFAVVVDNPYITVFVSSFIILSAIGVNLVANIISPAYVITLLTKVNYKVAVIITGLLAICAFPWVLVQDSSAKGLGLFISIYSAFLGPILSILLVDYFIFRKQKINVADLYKEDGPFSGINPSAVLAMLIGAGAAFIKVDLAWIVGLVVGGIAYFLLTKYAFKNSLFKKGTILETTSVRYEIVKNVNSQNTQQ